MSRNTTLRPCLKHSTDLDPPAPDASPLPFALCSSVLGPRVHFPPAPGLCQTHLTHSPSIYDRAPIVVLPNACALPERNGRTYIPSSECPSPPSSPSSSSSKKWRGSPPAHVAQGASLHPHAFATPKAQTVAPPDPAARLPPLVPDLSSSSESDESDVGVTPPDLTRFPSTSHPPISIVDGSSDAAALSFLPHANEREKPRREYGCSRSRGGPRSVRKSEFAAPELDGCLGGF